MDESLWCGMEGEEMGRDEFIAAMIDHLKQMEEEQVGDEGVTVRSRKKTAGEVHRVLSHDMPILTFEDVNTLNECLGNVANGTMEIPEWLVLSKKFQQGILYCMSRRCDDEDSRLQHGLAELCVNVFLRLFESSIENREVGARLLLSQGRAKQQSDLIPALQEWSDRVSYSMFAPLSSQAWMDLRVSAVLYRIIQKLRFGKPFLESGVLASGWARYLFILRDRMYSEPSSIPLLLPVIEELSRQENSEDARSIIFGSIAGVIHSPHLLQAAKQDQVPVWNYLRDNIDHVAAKTQALLRAITSVDEICSREESAIVRAELKSMLQILEFWIRGDPRMSNTSQNAISILLERDMLGALYMTWIDFDNLFDGGDYIGQFLLECVWRWQQLMGKLVALSSRLMLEKKLKRIQTSLSVDAAIWGITLSACMPGRGFDTMGTSFVEFLEIRESQRELIELRGRLREWTEFLEFISKRHVARRLVNWSEVHRLAECLIALRTGLNEFKIQDQPEAENDATAKEKDPLALFDRRQRVCHLIKRTIGRLDLSHDTKCD